MFIQVRTCLTGHTRARALRPASGDLASTGDVFEARLDRRRPGLSGAGDPRRDAGLRPSRLLPRLGARGAGPGPALERGPHRGLRGARVGAGDLDLVERIEVDLLDVLDVIAPHRLRLDPPSDDLLRCGGDIAAGESPPALGRQLVRGRRLEGLLSFVHLRDDRRLSQTDRQIGR
jgi:hypothetical protein